MPLVLLVLMQKCLSVTAVPAAAMLISLVAARLAAVSSFCLLFLRYFFERGLQQLLSCFHHN